MAKRKRNKPRTTEQTKAQTSTNKNVVQATGTAGEIFTFQVGGQSVIKRPARYTVYREMRNVPTIALAREIAQAPIRSAKWSIASEEGVSDDVTAFVHEEINRIWDHLLHDVLYGLDYGWSPFELIWRLRPDGMIGVNKVKPLLVDYTKPMYSDNGVLQGVKNKDIKIGIDNTFLWTYDQEADNVFGRSRHENIRETAYTDWIDISLRRRKYAVKVAGVIPIVEYPPGKSKDASGSDTDNFEIAKLVTQQLGMGEGVAMPNMLSAAAADHMRQGVDITKVKQWQIQFLESKGKHGDEFTGMLRHLESCLMRGWLVPERTGIEGQYGTKAESGTHGKLAVTLSLSVLASIIDAVNKQIVEPLIEYNYGQEHIDDVKIAFAGIDPRTQELLEKIATAFLTNQNNTDLFLKMVDLDQLFESTKIPKSSDPLPDDLVVNDDDDAANGSAFSRLITEIVNIDDKGKPCQMTA